MRNRFLIVAGLTLWATGLSSQAGASPGADGPYKISRRFIYPAAFKPGLPYTPGVLAGETLYISVQELLGHRDVSTTMIYTGTS